MDLALQEIQGTGLRFRTQRGTTTAEASANGRPDRRRSDVVEEFFLNPQQPTFALFAISICLLGVMDFIPKNTATISRWTDDDVRAVSGFYGPGVTLAWVATSLSMLYDANQNPKASPNGFDWLKYGTTILTGFWALGDAVWRALDKDFGPSYAAALYMSDKGFELGTLLYTVHFFPIHRIKKAQTPPAGSDEERAEQSTPLSSQVASSFPEYKLYPCVAMVSVWLWCRALANGHEVYIIPNQNPEIAMYQWDPLLPSWCKLIITILVFGTTAGINKLAKLQWWCWGLPAGILTSFAVLHSGLFGIYGPLKLTTIKITDCDQIFALVSTLLVLVVQYGREIAFIKSMGRHLRSLFVRSDGTGRR